MPTETKALYKNSILFFNKKTILLSSLTLIIVLSVSSGSLFFLKKIYAFEKIQADREAGMSLEAFSRHTVQVVDQVDMMLRGVRRTYLSTGSVPGTRQYIQEMNFTSVIHDVYLVSDKGSFIIPDDDHTRSKNVLDRDYFRYHQTHPEDTLFISPVEKGGKL